MQCKVSVFTEGSDEHVTPACRCTDESKKPSGFLTSSPINSVYCCPHGFSCSLTLSDLENEVNAWDFKYFLWFGLSCRSVFDCYSIYKLLHENDPNSHHRAAVLCEIQENYTAMLHMS